MSAAARIAGALLLAEGKKANVAASVVLFAILVSGAECAAGPEDGVLRLGIDSGVVRLTRDSDGDGQDGSLLRLGVGTPSWGILVGGRVSAVVLGARLSVAYSSLASEAGESHDHVFEVGVTPFAEWELLHGRVRPLLVATGGFRWKTVFCYDYDGNQELPYQDNSFVFPLMGGPGLRLFPFDRFSAELIVLAGYEWCVTDPGGRPETDGRFALEVLLGVSGWLF